jgi:perosamine synthetase
VVSAITHPDMVRILELHGLRSVPVDVDPGTLAPDRLGLWAAVGPRTRAILVAHLFGARIPLDDVFTVARRHGLLVIEDCAQSIEGPDDEGDERADVSFFSFGFIKTATALGGGLVRVADRELAERMRRLQEGWPVQPRREYAARAVRCLVALALSRPLPYGAVTRLVGDPGSIVRTVPHGNEAEFLGWLRRQPCGGLVRTLRRRLRRFPSERVRLRAQTGDEVAEGLPARLQRPGRAVRRSTHWLFPVVAPDPDALMAELRRHGFEATQGTSQIEAVEPRGRPAPPDAKALMAGIVFLPVYPEMPAAERARLLAVLHDCV